MKKIDAPTIKKSIGNKPKLIEEYVGRVNSNTESISIAKMSAPPNWKEPGQKPEFDEYTVVLEGSLKIESQNKAYFIKKGESTYLKSSTR